MKRHPGNTPTRLMLLLLAVSLALPLAAWSASVSLATSPLATSTTSIVKPNVLLMLDNSGSMGWDHMPDDASDAGSAVTFSYGYYGLRSSQCNEVYYNPAVTYVAPIKADGTSYANASFTGALPDGYKAASGSNVAVNLNTSFIASQSLSPDGSGQTAYYYAYSGAQTTQLLKNYNSTTNTFYNECHSAVNASPGQDVFTRVTLSSTAVATTATIVVSAPGGVVSTSVSGILLNGTQQIMSGTAASSLVSGTLATSIRDQINLCTSAKVGNCTTVGGHGYTATVVGSTVTLTGLAATATTLAVTRGNVGTMAFATTILPIADSAKLQNFANWYSYYRTRMLMMKTATGHAFSSLDKHYRVGFAKISSSGTPTVPLNGFLNATDVPGTGEVSDQRGTWYTALYNATASGSTPLRTALSDAGRYYAGKLAGTDPVQYSCQQNFTILSTDGFWNTGNGYQVDGSTAVGNQDGTAGRPMNDGAQATTQWVFTYTRNNYSKVTDNCSSGKKKLQTQPQIGTCTKAVSTGSCTPASWVSNGSATRAAACTNTAAPSASTPVQLGSATETAGTVGGTSDTLADVAMYYYQTDLRTPTLLNCGTAVAPATVGPLCENNVFISGNDNNQQQHMTTFTLGLGASGKMNYSSSYLSDTSGDYVSVKLGLTAHPAASPPVCSWQTDGTTCNWPTPGMTGSDGWIENIDDLWHAAVNGHGAYFSATDPTTLSDGLANALAGINARKGSAAAAATSTLNPVAGNNFSYVASYTTVTWKGNLEARGINIDNAVVDENASWCVENVPAGTCALPGVVTADNSGATTAYNCVTPNAVICTGGVLDGTDCKVAVAISCTGTMGAKVSDTSDTRIIKTANSGGTALINFDAAYASANPTYFDASRASTLTTLGQWTTLTAAQRTAAAGVNLLNYLRGQYGYEERSANVAANRLYRYREAVMGDAVESQPAYISKPVFSYPYPGYSTYKTAQVARAGTVYMGANDGMMHAFAADTGIERWAYIPSMVIPNLWKLADTDYASYHANFVNGSPITSDICTANCTDAATAVWKTILVAGLNGGGRGYYALDITVPTAPVLLWEFTTTAGIGKTTDDDLGYSFGQPIITRRADGTWVVVLSSGYNNTSPGDGKGYLYVLNAGSGAILSKIATGIGSTTTPSGLARIAGWNNEPAGNQTTYVYGGDLLGNVWRFDIGSATVAAIGTGDVMKFAVLYSDAGSTTVQPVTTTPVLGKIDGKRVVFIGTGKYLETGDLTTTQKQSEYAIKDDNATTTLINPRLSLVNQTLTSNPDGTATRLASSNPVNFYSGRGWYIDFPDSGERVNIDSKLVMGTLEIATIVPSNTVCAPGGYGWLNYVDYKTGGAIDAVTHKGSVKYDAPIVGVNILYIQGQPKVEVVTSTNPTPELNTAVDFKATPTGFTGKRVIWRELIP